MFMFALLNKENEDSVMLQHVCGGNKWIMLCYCTSIVQGG